MKYAVTRLAASLRLSECCPSECRPMAASTPPGIRLCRYCVARTWRTLSTSLTRARFSIRPVSVNDLLQRSESSPDGCGRSGVTLGICEMIDQGQPHSYPKLCAALCVVADLKIIEVSFAPPQLTFFCTQTMRNIYAFVSIVKLETKTPRPTMSST